MENITVSFKYFDQSLVQRVIDFADLSDDSKTKESIKAFSEELKSIYQKKDAELKLTIKEQLTAAKKSHLEALEALTKKLEQDLEEANSRGLDLKELGNVRFGLETACRRAKIKEKNRMDFHGTRQELIDMGYSPCGNCHP